MSEYYDDIFNSDNPTQSAGWRHPIEQALRFEFALAGYGAWAPSTTLLDVGCGPGALYRYLYDTGRALNYTGLDAYAPGIELAQQLSPDGQFVIGDVIRSSRKRQQFDAVVAIGAVVDGNTYRTTIDRHRRLLSMIRAICSRASRYVCVIILKQEVILKNPGLFAEPALVGATRDELDALMRHLSQERQMSWRIEDNITRADRALYVLMEPDTGSDMEPLQEDMSEMCSTSVCESVLDGPWGKALPDWRRAWFWWVVGDCQRANGLLGPPHQEEPIQHTQLRMRLELELNDSV